MYMEAPIMITINHNIPGMNFLSFCRENDIVSREVISFTSEVGLVLFCNSLSNNNKYNLQTNTSFFA